jgi:hypothetical protein
MPASMACPPATTVPGTVSSTGTTAYVPPKGTDADGEAHTGDRDRDDAELGLQELGDKLKTPKENRHSISTFDAL